MEKKAEQVMEFDLHMLWAIAVEKKVVVVGLIMIGVLLAAVPVLLRPSIYESTVQVRVQSSGESTIPELLEIIKTDDVLGPMEILAAKDVKKKEYLSKDLRDVNMKASAVKDTKLIVIKVQADTADKAYEQTQGIKEHFLAYPELVDEKFMADSDNLREVELAKRSYEEACVKFEEFSLSKNMYIPSQLVGNVVWPASNDLLTYERLRLEKEIQFRLYYEAKNNYEKKRQKQHMEFQPLGEATEPKAPLARKSAFWIVAGGVAGLMLGFVYILVLYRRRGTMNEIGVRKS